MVRCEAFTGSVLASNHVRLLPMSGKADVELEGGVAN